MIYNKDFDKFMISSIGSHKLNSAKKAYGYVNPTIVEERSLNIAVMDVFSRLMMDRIIFLGCPIYDEVSSVIQSQLLYLDSISNDDITIVINSPGGEVYSGLGIYDTILGLKSNVNTNVRGFAASMGAIILLAGNQRSAEKHSRIMLHQPLGGIDGQATDIQLYSELLKDTKNELYDIISERTSIKRTDCPALFDRDNWMKPQEAFNLGIINKLK